MANPLQNLAPFPFLVELSKEFSLIHSNLLSPPNSEAPAANHAVQTVRVNDMASHLKIAQHYALDELELFLQALEKFNHVFITKKKTPNLDEKEEVFLGAAYLKMLPRLINESRWSALYLWNTEKTAALQNILKTWLHSMRRTLISTYELERIFEVHYLTVIQDHAKQAISQLKWRMIGETHEVKRVFRQYIHQLRPFASGEKKRQEKINLAQDALMRLKVSTASTDPRNDDILHHVGNKIESENVNVVDFLQNADNSTGLTPEQQRNVTRKFLSTPFNRSMTPKSFSSLIKMVESYGAPKQKASLYELSLFQENAGKLETTNRDQGKNRIVIPRNLAAFIPKYKFFPSLFQDVARRYDFFKNKHWLIHLMKDGIEKFLAPEFCNTPTLGTLVKCQALHKMLDSELKDIESHLNSLYRWNKKSKALLNEWKDLVSGASTKISDAIKNYESALDALEAVEPQETFDQDFQNALREAENIALKEKRRREIPTFFQDQKRIINACTEIFRLKSCETISPDLLRDILMAFQDAYLAKQANSLTSEFHKACRKEANEVFKIIANHFLALSKKDWENLDIPALFSQLDLFSQVTTLITQEKNNGKFRKAFPREEQPFLQSMKERVLINQILLICKKVEALTENDSFSNDIKSAQRLLLERIRDYAQGQDLTQIHEDCLLLLEKLNDGSNRHIIQIQFASVRELIEERTAPPSPKISHLSPGMFCHPQHCGTQAENLISAVPESEACAL